MVNATGDRSPQTLSSFNPSNFSVEPPPPPDYLAGAVLQGLSRPIGGRLSWGVLKSIILGAVSFGLLPIISWSRNFRAFMVAEQQQFLHLAQWVRQNSNHSLARQLESDARDLRPRFVLWWMGILTALGTMGAIYLMMAHGRYFTEWDQLIAGTYGAGRSRVFGHRVIPMFSSRHIYTVWVFGLGAAYLMHALQVHLHAADVKRFVAHFSEIAQSEGGNRVKAASLGTTLRPLWLVGAAVFVVMGAPWGVVAMLAGAAQRRYITCTSRETRSDLAQRLRTMLVRRRPSADVVAPVYLRERCIEPRCRAEILRGVNFCPRCGTRQKAQAVTVSKRA
jgi:hypothetical protein